jgi:hypothetical protein|tara:strand:+ start:2002 stop:2223 length:222 start_codon:yes stop_codon:yes gene_type:complete
MVSEILFGMDETTLAYDLQRAHSADVWFLRARFWLWGTIGSVVSFFLGHAISLWGINLYSSGWHLLSSLWGGH